MSLESFYNDFNMLERIKPILTEANVTMYTQDFIKDSFSLLTKEFFERLAKSVNHSLFCFESDIINKRLLNEGSVISLEQYQEIFDKMSSEFQDKVNIDLTKPPKTIRELVNWSVERVEKEWWDIQDVITSYHLNFFPRIRDANNFDAEWFDEESRIQIHYIKDYCFDGRRTYTWAYITLDDEPKMIFYRAGRDGCDHFGFFSIDDGWQELNDVLATYCEFDDMHSHTSVSLDDEISESFTEVYGYNLLSEFKPWNM